MRKRKSIVKKTPREVFLVICEGETEKEYVELLKQRYRLPILIKTKVTRTSVNQRLVTQYLSEVGLEKGDNHHVFFVYDADVDCIVEKLKKLDGILILSNPCVEVWFILHIKDYRKPNDSCRIVDELRSAHPIWASYMKGRFTSDQIKCLNENRDIAIERVKRMDPSGNPASNMYILLEELERASNCK